MAYTFTVEDPDGFLTPRTSQGAEHALKCRDEVDEHRSDTQVLGFTTPELVALYDAVGARLADTYAKQYANAKLPPRGAW